MTFSVFLFSLYLFHNGDMCMPSYTESKRFVRNNKKLVSKNEQKIGEGDARTKRNLKAFLLEACHMVRICSGFIFISLLSEGVYFS